MPPQAIAWAIAAPVIPFTHGNSLEAVRSSSDKRAEQYRAVEAEALRQLDGLIEATYFCPDVPGQHSSCRKPAPGMILQAKREHGIDLSRSFFIGDKEIDVECGRNAGVRTIRVQTGFQHDTARSTADWVAEDLAAAAEIILKSTA